VILLWGPSYDAPLAAVRRHLERSDEKVLILDLGGPQAIRIERPLDEDARGKLRIDGQAFELEDVTAAYLRPHDTRSLVAKLGEEASAHARALEATIESWADLTRARVLNRPSDMASNNSKPYQLALLRAAGFDVPETLVTTDPAAVLEFWDRHARIIYKSTSGERSIVSRLCDRHRDYLDDVSHCPTQFQEYIDGCDYRVHVVDDEVFACRIESTADDYRYPDLRAKGSQPRLCPAEIPLEIAQSCVELARRLHLPLVGIDLRLSSRGHWVAFEANPSPAFSCFEPTVGLPIAASVARLLAGGGRLTAAKTCGESARGMASPRT
jgi:hypothetical protein